MPYYGGKQSIARQIVQRFPAHEHYVEPFAGSLAVLLAKKPSPHETVNDISRALMRFWRVLRDRPDDLERACALTPHSRAEYEDALAVDLATVEDDLECARLVWVLLTQGRAGTLRSTGWRHYQSPAGSSTSMPRYLKGYIARIAAVAERLAAVSLECRPALEVIQDYGRYDEVLLYVDPPYLGTVRSRNYQHEMMSEAAHRELAEALNACRAAVVISGYPSPLYDRLYKGWHRVELTAHTGQARQRRRVEVLWSNRPVTVATPLFDLVEAS
ncbi:DNA adenine methylase (plasmid) [Thermobispora bispora]|nr:DNA adenine methylase [Thermobispora bispora]